MTPTVWDPIISTMQYLLDTAAAYESYKALLRDIYSYAEDQGMETLMDMIDAEDEAHG